MSTRILCLLMLSLFGWTLIATGLAAGSTTIDPRLLTNRWPAAWITHPSAPSKDFGVFHLRKSFELARKPGSFVIHVSADNRYRLFVNGSPVSAGPERGDLLRWRFETVDIASRLRVGKNVLAAVVWNFGEFMPWAQTTLRTGFILQGDTQAESLVSTGAGWKIFQDPAYSPYEEYRKNLYTFMVVGPGERVDGQLYPWGWQEVDFDDSAWLPARRLDNGVPYGVGTDGAWFLSPRSIPMPEEKIERIGTRDVDGATVFTALPEFDGQRGVPLPANQRLRLLLDQKYLTTAYPELLVSGGKGATVTVTYAEALFDEKGEKGQRDEIVGRKIKGMTDVFLPDGGQRRLFRPLWFRTYRYIQLDVETKDDPITIHDFYGVFTAYPFVQNASFSSSDASLEEIWNVGWRTARLCAGETYFDCPYYEQLQYVGDTRIQALISLYVSGDDRLMRKAIQVFDDSRLAEGLTLSRYPCSSLQVIPPYSLFWIAMIHDYWMHRDDAVFVQSFLPGIEAVLGWHERRMDPSDMLGATPWWNFVDWPDEWPWTMETRAGGVPALDSAGRSSILSLQLAYALDLAADLYKGLGRTEQAARYASLSEKIKQTTYRLCWDESRGLMADTPDRKAFSQHANALAVLTGAVPDSEIRELMDRVAKDRSLIQCTMYYRFYLYRAMKKAGLGDRYVEMLAPWRDMLKLGLTTFAERPEPTRSDCHAWSASPNYELLASVCGIEPAAPGFRSVRIEPNLGPLNWAEGAVPHPKGTIRVKLTRKGSDGLQADISLPEGLTGELVWRGKTVALKSGEQSVEM